MFGGRMKEAASGSTRRSGERRGGEKGRARGGAVSLKKKKRLRPRVSLRRLQSNDHVLSLRSSKLRVVRAHRDRDHRDLTRRAFDHVRRTTPRRAPATAD